MRYFVDRFLDDKDIEHLLHTYQSTKILDQPQGKNIRHCTIYNVRGSDNNTINQKLLPLVEDFGYSIEKKYIYEYSLLRYDIDDYVVRHYDNGSGRNNRIVSTVTLLEESSDLEGGKLHVEEKELNLQVGETVVMDSKLVLHHVTKVLKGHRVVLVCWINKSN